jgi:hypothetical protein
MTTPEPTPEQIIIAQIYVAAMQTRDLATPYHVRKEQVNLKPKKEDTK